MITELKLENWKSFEKSSLYIDPLSILVGTNSSGKSNALDALLLLNRIALGSSLTTALQGDGALAPMRGGLEWAARQPQTIFAIGVICRVDDNTDYEYKIQCTINDKRCEILYEELARTRYRLKTGRRTSASRIFLFKTDPPQPGALTIVGRLYNEKQGSPRTLSRSNSIIFQLMGQRLRQEIDDGVAEVLKMLRGIFILDPIPSHMRTYSPLSESLESDARNIAGVLAALSTERQEKIEKELIEYVSHLPERDIKRVHAEPVGKFKSDAMLYCEEDWAGTEDTHVVDARGMSDGTLRFLAIMTALLTRPEGSLLVIEEVDNGLHPSRANLLLEMLKSIGKKQKIDVLITTHNPALLDAMKTDMVPFITVAHRDTETGYSVLTPLEDIKQLPKLLAQGPIGHLSSTGLIERILSEGRIVQNQPRFPL